MTPKGTVAEKDLNDLHFSSQLDIMKDIRAPVPKVISHNSIKNSNYVIVIRGE